MTHVDEVEIMTLEQKCIKEIGLARYHTDESVGRSSHHSLHPKYRKIL